MRLFFGKFWSQSKDFWGNMSLTKRITLGAVVGLLVAGMAALLTVQSEEPYEYVFTELSGEDSQAIITYLKNNNVTFNVDAKGIKVPTKDVLQLRLKLTQEGLPNHGVIGWEKFDAQEFTRTEFEQRINKQRAIQGELSRTIQMIDGVTYAKVHIVSPKKSLFLEDQTDPTAAIYLKTKPGINLDKKQIRGLVNLVSRSVEGLKPNNVTIIDGEGKMLTEIESEDYASKMTKEMVAYKRTVEKQKEENIRAIVGRIVGQDRIEVKIDSEVDFTQEQTTTSDVDPDRVVVLSKETQGYRLDGGGVGTNPTGIPGAKSNVPGEAEPLAATAGGGGGTKSNKDSELVNFEVSKKISQKTMPVGNIKRLTVAVLVDGKQEYPADGTKPTFEARTPEDLKQIEDLVRSAVGIDEKRGDSVTVRNVMFQLDQVQMDSIKEEKKETRQYISTLTVSSAIALALVLFFAFIVRPYFRWLAYDPERKQEQQFVEEYKPDLELGALQNVQIKEDVPFEKLSPQEQVLYLAKNEPKRTTEALRLLLNPHQSIGGA